MRFYLWILLCIPVMVWGQSGVLVDFGADRSSTVTPVSGWDELLLAPEMTFTSTGPGGVVLSQEGEEYTDFRGIRGHSRSFSRGDRIVVTWYNDSDQTIFFTGRISFTDADAPAGGTSEGHWFTMRSAVDYQQTYTPIAPQDTAKTVFHIQTDGVHQCDGPHTLVNINTHIQWFATGPKRFLVCDKIELLSDADIQPPSVADDLTATPLSDSKIAITWQPSTDPSGVYGYLITCNGQVHGFSRTPGYTAVFLEPNRTYRFAVQALDALRNKSETSVEVTATTLPFDRRPDLIHPGQLSYRGAFRLPETFVWGAEAMAFMETDGADNGVLLVTNVNQPEQGWVGQVAIPQEPVSSPTSFEAFPVAPLLQEPVDIRPDNINNRDYVDIWRTGLTVVPAEERLYSAWSIHYTVSGEKHPSVSCCDLSDLSGSDKMGAWYLGDPSRSPIDAMTGDYLFCVPQSWADAHTAGRSLVTGRYRDGGLSGMGPTLYAFAPVGTVPPEAGEVVDYTPLVQYGSVLAADEERGLYPDALDGYRHSDELRDAVWLASGDQSAVIVVGNKAQGEHWYGYSGQEMRHEWVIADVPSADFYATDPFGKGWRSQQTAPVVLFYDPADLAEVANGSRPSHDPQPYGVKRLDPGRFWHESHEIRSIAFDNRRGYLYVSEFVADRDGAILVHRWEVEPDSPAVGVESHTARHADWVLRQNVPNPFNHSTTISFSLAVAQPVTVSLYDLTGKKVATLFKGYCADATIRVDAGELASGIYVYQLETPQSRECKTMVLVK